MIKFDAPALVKLSRVQSIAASSDGTWLAVAVQRLDEPTASKYVSDVWRVPLDGAEPVRLTHGKWNDHSPAFRHDGSLVFLSNRPTGATVDDGHDRRTQLFAFPLTGGEPVCLTDEPLGVAEFKVAADTDTFCVIAPLLPDVPYDEQRATMKERSENGPSALVYDDMPARFWDHWLPAQHPHLVAYVGGVRKDLTTAAGTEMHRSEWALAPNGSFVSLHSTRPGSDRISDQVAERIDVATGDRKMLAAADRAWFSSPVISDDGQRIAMTHLVREDGRYGAPELIVMNANTGEFDSIAVPLDAHLFPFAWSSQDEILLAGPLDTHRPVFALEITTGSLTRITSESAGGTHFGLSLSKGRVVGIRSSLTQPPEPFVCEIADGAEPHILTNLSGFDGADFASVENHTVTSTDGVGVQYYVVRPKDGAGELPAMMAIHGGPIADWGDIWHWRWNSLVMAAEGYVVALPNPRGSVGFGQDFIEGIWNNQWGAQCYEDLMTVADALEARRDVDVNDVTALGGSFGGYMTNWIGTQTDRFSSLVTHASIFDMRAFHGVTDLPAWWAFSFGIHPYEERAQYDHYSPIAHISNWKTRTLIIHGDKDYRVPIGESLALFEALRFHDVETRFLVFPDENHWILRPKNIESWYKEVLGFIAN